MTHSLRALLIGSAAFFFTSAFAQPIPPYQVTVSGIVIGCTPNSSVNILTVQNTQPPIDIDVPLDGNCEFTIDLSMDSFQGWFQISTPCNGAIQTAIGTYTVNALDPDSNYVFVAINCGGPAEDCLGVPGGNAMPGTSCTTFLGVVGTWSADCECVPNSTTCNACFTLQQTNSNPNGGGGVPWFMTASNCSSGAAPLTYQWWMPDGNPSAIAEPTYEFTEAGVYGICLTITDAGGCTSTLCDTVVVDENGWISTGPVAWDCLQIPNGPNMPGTSCATALGGPGTWNDNCECIPDNPVPCEAGFWVIQAYGIDSIGNPNGVGEPIPFELWVWNLSSGGTGNYQFVWDFGDGTTSTDPFPTHTYANSGPYELCLTMTDAAGCTDTYCETIEVDEDGFLGFAGDGGARSTLTINVIQELPTGLQEQENLETTGLWPNPVENEINLTLNSSRSGNLNLSVVDMNGRILRTMNQGIQTGRNQMTLGLDGLDAGAYLLRIDNGHQAKVQRFVKIR